MYKATNKVQVVAMGTTVRPGSSFTHIVNKDFAKGFLSSKGNYLWQEHDYDHGSSFLVSTDFGHMPTGSVSMFRANRNDWNYRGSLCVDVPNTFTPPTTPDLGNWGATAFARMKPTKPSFAGINAAYELRELPRMLKARFTPDLKGASNYWLALQFGWKPLLRDVRELCSLQREAQKRLKQLLRDNGRPVRRRISLAETSDTSIISEGTVFGGTGLKPILDTRFFSGNDFRSVRETTSGEVWASARFRYWLPGGPRDIAWRRRMLAAIYGLYPTPSVVYNMVPWSWLVDWFTNLGDVIENMDAGVADRLAADYCYIMSTMRRIQTISQIVNYYNGQGAATSSIALSSQRGVIIKERLKGDPFGFGTKESSLSGMQLSILGALGVSRL